MTPDQLGQPVRDEDPILAEVRAIREAIFAGCGYDLAAYFRYIREQEQVLRREGRVFLDPPPAPAERPADRDAA